MRCNRCKKEVKEEVKFFYSGKNLTFCCAECFQNYLKISKEEESRRSLYSQICKTFSIEALDGKLLNQLKNLHNSGLSYNNIAAVFHYMYDIKQIKIISPTLFYVKDYIEEAKNYYKDIQEKEKTVEDLKIKQEEQERKATIIKPNYNYNNKKKNSRLKIDPSQV